MNTLAAILLLLTVQRAFAINYGVQWSTSPNVTTLVVACNDTITFTWQGKHGVAKAATGNCLTTAGFVQLANATTGGTYTYNVGPNDLEVFYLYCSIEPHCALGQIVQVNNTCATPKSQSSNQTTTNTTVNSTVVAASPDVAALDATYDLPGGRRQIYCRWKTGRIIPQANMACGDELQFMWKSTLISHGILMKPYVPYAMGNMTCEDKIPNGKDKVELVAPIYTATFTWTPTENGDYMLLCQVGAHCYNGQWLRASVRGCANDSLVYKPYDGNGTGTALGRSGPAAQLASSSTILMPSHVSWKVLVVLGYLVLCLPNWML